ncbi:MAG: hypothetical protein G3M70_06020 [Candidatus Nitronauta litoralis]|uniref:Uncharacterized protein n=1 Tax=Candidatus Nitronauta litoralis TaxID=2705533 RepID=A0A7T0BV01_9BACT|nr:MAG: hypothetical protein G3M70_06020 [Candidatus Nitronauta litoralis]
MIDWGQLDINKVTFEVDAEGVQELTGAVVIPLKVFDGSGQFIFTHPVSIRSEFYLQLKTVDGWQVQFNKILQSRLKEELGRRRQRSVVSIQDRLKLSAIEKTISG